jgi:hypothetical protein
MTRINVPGRTDCNIPARDLNFYPWLPFGFDPEDNNYPDNLREAGGQEPYNCASINPLFAPWGGFGPYLNLVDTLIAKSQSNGLAITDFEIEQELNIREFPVYGRLIAYTPENGPTVNLLKQVRNRMSAKQLSPGDVTISTQIERPTLAGFSCTSGYGEPATIGPQSALFSAIRGGAFGRIDGGGDLNGLFCRVSPLSTDGEVIVPEHLPDIADEPALINVHSHVAVPNPGTPFTLQSADITTQAKRLYDDLHLFRLFSRWATKTVTFSPNLRPPRTPTVINRATCV